MNKKYSYILIFLILSIILILIGIMSFLILNKDYNFNSFKKIVSEKTYSIAKTEDLLFLFDSSDVAFYKSSNDKLKVIQYGNDKTKKYEEIVTDNRLVIKDKRMFRFCFLNCSNSKYKIYIPNSYLNNLEIETTSGEIDFSIDKMNLNKFETISVSGNIDLNSIIKAKNIELKTVSGEIYINQIESVNNSIKTTSGDISADSIKANKSSIKTVSGEISINELENSLTLRTTSGDIKIDDLKIVNNSSIKTVSGEVDINMNNDSKCKILTDTVSGDVNVSKREFKNDNNTFQIATTSGDIEIE